MTMFQSTPPKVQASALAVLFSVVFINLVGFGLVVPLLPFFAQSLKAEAWQITLMFSAYSLGQFFAEPFWGRLSDRIGRKPVLLMTLVANALGYLMLAFVPNIWLAIAVRLFTGLGAGNISTVQGYVADVTPPEQRAGRMGLIGAAFGLGFIVGPGLGGLLTQPQMGHIGYQLPIFLASALAALAAVGVIVFLRESRAKADPAAPRPAFLSGLKAARDNAVVSRVLVVTLIYMAGFSAMESVFGLWAEQRYQWGAREVGLSFMIVGVVSTLNQGFRAAVRRIQGAGDGDAAVRNLAGAAGPGARGLVPGRAARDRRPDDPGGAGLDHSARDGGRGLRHVLGHAQHLGHDQPGLPARPAGRHARAEHGVQFGGAHFRSHDRRRPFLGAGARLALPDRGSADDSRGGDGDQCGPGDPQRRRRQNPVLTRLALGGVFA